MGYRHRALVTAVILAGVGASSLATAAVAGRALSAPRQEATRWPYPVPVTDTARALQTGAARASLDARRATYYWWLNETPAAPWPFAEGTVTATATITATAVVSATPVLTLTETAEPTATITATAIVSRETTTPTVSPTVEPTPSDPPTPTVTRTPTRAPTPNAAGTLRALQTAIGAANQTMTARAPTRTPTRTATASRVPLPTVRPTATWLDPCTRGVSACRIALPLAIKRGGGRR